MHRLLTRQIRKFLIEGNKTVVSLKEIRKFLDSVNSAYIQNDENSKLLERSLELTSEELVIHYRTLREEIKDKEKDKNKIVRLNQLYSTLSEINELVLRESDEKKLLQSVCKIIVDHGGMHLAWIGLYNRDINEVQLYYYKDDHKTDIPENIQLAMINIADCYGPTGNKMLPEESLIINDLINGKDNPEWSWQAKEQGCKSIAVFPLYIKNNVIGSFTICSDKDYFFDQKEIELITKITGQISFALQSRQHEKKILELAYHDALTSLPNRVFFEEKLGNLLGTAKKNKTKLLIGLIDLDNFNQVNNSFGYSFGDMVLLKIRDKLNAILRGEDFLARISGDKFVIIFTNLTNEKETRSIASNIIELNQKPLYIEETSLHVFFSLGLTIYPDDASGVQKLLSHAEQAMFQAKDMGRNSSCFYGDFHNKDVFQRKISLRNDLATAIRDKKIIAFFQPKFDLNLNRITGMEALARWNHNGKTIEPSLFIPLAEENGLIGALSDSIMEQSMAFLKDLNSLGEHKYKISVNISRRQLFAVNFSSKLFIYLSKYNLEPEDVVLEITESTAGSDKSFMQNILGFLRDTGFSLSLDDFGTGYSSLSQLHEIPFDELKLDISFVRRIDTPKGLRMIKAITQIGRALSLKMVAEGVEDEKTIAKLSELGVNIFQGYFYGKALSANDFKTKLKLN